MADLQRPDDLAALHARIAAQEARIAQLERRRGLPRRFLPLAFAVVLVALVPLATLAANPVFSDLNQAATVHRPNIQAIGNAGIAQGVEDPANPGQRLYFPNDLVTRQEMASFLARAAGLGGNPPVANALTAQSVRTGLAEVQRIIKPQQSVEMTFFCSPGQRIGGGGYDGPYAPPTSRPVGVVGGPQGWTLGTITNQSGVDQTFVLYAVCIGYPGAE